MFSLALALALVVPGAAPKSDTRLVGTWLLEGRRYATFNADGTGVVEGEPMRWVTRGGTLLVTDAEGEVDTVPFTIEGGVLKAQVGLTVLTLTREGKKGTAPAPSPEAPKKAGQDELSRLLLSSNWCWLRYASGNTYTQKVHFSADGTWQDYSESDIWVPGSAEANRSQQGGGRWQVKNGQLWLSSPDSPQLAPVPLTVTRNSNGYPIINADGREYSMCR